MKCLKVKIEGTKPTLMHNGQLADPLNCFSQEAKAISKKQKKTEEEFKELSKLEVLGSLYLGGNPPRPVWPAPNLHALVREGAKPYRASKKVSSSVSIIDDAVLEYDGPKDPMEIALNPDFVDRRRCTVNRSSVFRSRPIFRNWGLTMTVYFDENEIDRRDLEKWIATAGIRVGLSDHRPYYGTFRVVSVEEVPLEKSHKKGS